MELPNHLVPWDTVKKLLEQAKRDAWDEGRSAFRTETNPYQESK